MPFPRKRSPVQFSQQEMLKLESIRKSRTEEKRRTLRAAFLLDSLSGQSDEAIAQHHHAAAAAWCCVFRSFFNSVWTQRWENYPGAANRGNYRTMRLSGYNTVLARSRRNWDIPTNCGRTGYWSLTYASTASPPGTRRCSD